jgi:cell division protein FtsN
MSMLKLRLPLAVLVTFAGAIATAQAQTAPAARAPTAPGVTRAVEHPDPTVDQTQPDPNQPATAADDQKKGPETASDAPKKSPQDKKADELAKQGVRSNTPPPGKPSS